MTPDPPKRTKRNDGRPNVQLTMPMLTRIRALRDLELSAEATARVIELDFGVKPAAGTIQRVAPVGTYRAGAARGLAGIAHAPPGHAFRPGNVQGKVPES